jgi:uncharacterized protein YggE
VHLEVTGMGASAVAPDRAVISLSVITQASTRAEAIADNARRTRAVIEAVSMLPILAVTSSGTGVTLIPNRGFRATQSITIVGKPEDIARIHDAGVRAGANQSSGVHFEVADAWPARKAALRLAVARARADAHVVARAAGVGLLGPAHVHIEPEPGRFAGVRVVYRTAT